MSERLPPCPTAPDFRVDWDFLDGEYDWIRDLRGCPQDPIYHAEGDVWIHTRMVCEALAALPAWQSLEEATRRIVFTAALMHDMAKPECTRLEPDGRITSRGHSRRGSIRARRVLWEMGVPFDVREQVTGLIRFHQSPYFVIDREDARRLVLEISQSARCDHLAVLAEADVRGRICQDQQRLLDNVALFVEFAREQGCLDGAYVFPTEHTRFMYFQGSGREPDAPVHADFRAEVILTSGLPGSGKDHWVRSHCAGWPVISLDDVRTELEIDPDKPQGEVINQARERAREYLRKKLSFVWNATNLSRQLRRACISLFADYSARVRIVYLEVPPEILFPQNRQRPAPVPEKVIERLLDRWETPDLTEAHQLDFVIRDSEPGE
jgi:predicted kinase